MTDIKPTVVFEAVSALDKALDALIKDRVESAVNRHINTDEVLSAARIKAKHDVRAKAVEVYFDDLVDVYLPGLRSVRLKECADIYRYRGAEQFMVPSIGTVAIYSRGGLFQSRVQIQVDKYNVTRTGISAWEPGMVKALDQIAPAFQQFIEANDNPATLLCFDQPRIEYLGVDPTNGVVDNAVIDWLFVVPEEETDNA